MSSSNQISTDSLTRQRQINEWSYEEKMQTLFMMQLVFLVLLVLVASAALSSAGIITSSIGMLIGVVAFAFIVVIWVYRYAYTRNIRDKVQWNKRHFSGDYAKAPTVSADALANAAKCSDK